jgi:hypothetical protein
MPRRVQAVIDADGWYTQSQIKCNPSKWGGSTLQLLLTTLQADVSITIAHPTTSISTGIEVQAVYIVRKPRLPEFYHFFSQYGATGASSLRDLSMKKNQARTGLETAR